jgi:predicted  nucleic acid-binding Zn-ribbon protein
MRTTTGVAECEDEEVHVEERIARLESDVGHLRTDVAEIKVDIRDLRGSLRALSDKTDASFKSISDKTDASFKSISEKMDASFTRVNECFTEVHKSIAGLSVVVERNSADLRVAMAMHKVWWFVMLGGVLAFIARAFKWI